MPNNKIDWPYIHGLIKHFKVRPQYVPHVESVLGRIEHINKERFIIQQLVSTCPEWFHQ